MGIPTIENLVKGGNSYYYGKKRTCFGMGSYARGSDEVSIPNRRSVPLGI
jgi:hypothetical protein